MAVNGRVLLVDDDESFLELFAPQFAAHDLEVLPVSSPRHALDLLDQEPIDLLVSDVQMPELTGIELFRSVQDRHPDIPVILITAFGSTEDAIQAVKQGAFHYFEKPLFDKLELFWTTMREALAKRRMLKELDQLSRERALQAANPYPSSASHRPSSGSGTRSPKWRNCLSRCSSAVTPGPARNWWPRPSIT